MYLPLTPVRFLYRAVDLFGEKLAVVSDHDRWTYREFAEHCERVAAGLLHLGIQPGDRIAYLSFNTVPLLAGYFGPLLIQAVFMPLNVRLTAPELSRILQTSPPAVLLFEHEFAPVAAQLRQACPSLRNLIALDRMCPEADLTYAELLSGGRLPRPALSSFDERNVAELFHTSGTTAEPKPVPLSHRSLYLHALAMNTALRQTPVELHAIPLFHANGWGRPHTAAMQGATQVLLRRFRPASVFSLIARDQISGISLVPVMARTLLDSPDLIAANLRSLQHIHLGGAPVSPALITELSNVFQCEISAGYGLSEAGPVVAVSNGVAENSVTYAPLPGVEIRIQNHELQVRSDHLAENCFGWLETGDLAIWTGGSSFRFFDRRKEIIISGGENISSVELEEAINAHPAVLESAVVAVADVRWGERPAAFVVLVKDACLSAEELLAFLQRRLAKYKLPRQVSFVQGPLPRTATGKLLKSGLAAWN